MKKWIAAALALLLVVGGIYVGSPYYAIYALRNAAREGDADKIAGSVDFPAVRESLKTQLSSAMTAKLQGDAALRDNPLAALGAALLPTIADRMVDNFVTPEGIAAMMRGQKPRDKAEASSDVQADTDYLNLNAFRVNFRNSRRDQAGPSFLLERRGFASWKLVRIDLPTDLLNMTP
jgi:hypothetical protein